MLKDTEATLICLNYNKRMKDNHLVNYHISITIVLLKADNNM